jgi:chorismate mutase / prephenate dehydratase
MDRVAAVKNGIGLRLGRQAAILRRLLARHRGALPPQTVVRVWLELLAGTTTMQGPLVVAVCEADPGYGLTQAAREQFGALTPLRVHGSAAKAITEVSERRATVAVLPMPVAGESARAAWWTALLQKDEPRMHVIGQLPLWASRPNGAPLARALVAAAIAPDPSGEDRSLLGLELDRDVSQAHLAGTLTAAGLAPEAIILRRDPTTLVAHALVDVAGFVTDDDPRLTRLSAVLRPPVVLGAFAVPIGEHL